MTDPSFFAAAVAFGGEPHVEALLLVVLSRRAELAEPAAALATDLAAKQDKLVADLQDKYPSLRPETVMHICKLSPPVRWGVYLQRPGSAAHCAHTGFAITCVHTCMHTSTQGTHGRATRCLHGRACLLAATMK